jgi:hypothetical protein
MGLPQAHTEHRRESLADELSEQQRRVRITAPLGPDEDGGRHEPHSLVERSVPVDPYAAWLAEREADAERMRESRPQIRLIQRRRGGDGRRIVAHRL